MVESKGEETSQQKNRRIKSDLVTQKPEYGAGPGKTTIAPEVLLAIARLAALDTPGVSRMSSVPGPVSRFRRGAAEGVNLEIQDDYVIADLYLVMQNGVNLRDVSRKVQLNVSRAISEMVGMQVGRVNIHIDDIDYPTE